MRSLADKLLDLFESRGCVLPDIGLLQPADPLLETAGEDLRRRIFITADQHGAVLCLRPEFTVPVCLHHLASGRGAARYGYAGRVFRQRAEEPAEFGQAGIEDIGGDDPLAADVAAIADCCAAVEAAGLVDYRLVMGDQALFTAVLASLELPLAWQKRLGRNFGDLRLLGEDIERLAGRRDDAGPDLPDAVKALIRAGDRDGVEAWVDERMREAGLPAVGVRTAAEVAARTLEKAELAAARLDEAHRRALEAFLAQEAPVGEAAARLAALAAEHRLAIDGELAGFAARADALMAAGLDTERFVYRAGFGRRLDYYTGLVFELRVAESARPIAGGGRYDRLMTLLGAEKAQPAVGFSIWLDRLRAACPV